METLLTALMRLPLLGRLFENLLTRVHRATVGAMRRVHRTTVRPREWSNAELRRVAHLFDGDVVNVSGWRDEDKEGRCYRSYFSSARTYAVTNYVGERGATGAAGEIDLDLEGAVPAPLLGRFQVALNHTVLEHVFELRTAIANICRMSHDTVILVTPFLQAVHFEAGSYGDWWRPSPMCIARILRENGFEVLYQSSNDNPWYIVYVFTVACRDPSRYRGRIPEASSATHVGSRHFGMAEPA